MSSAPEDDFAELLLVGPGFAAAIGAVVALCTGADAIHLGVSWGLAALALILAGGIFCVAVDVNPPWLATLLAVPALAVMAGSVLAMLGAVGVGPGVPGL